MLCQLSYPGVIPASVKMVGEMPLYGAALHLNTACEVGKCLWRLYPL
jgi:hypothetical protein